MKLLARYSSQKDQSHWEKAGRQIMLQAESQGGLWPLSLKTRPMQAVFGVILILVLTTLFTAVITVGENMSLKVRIGLTFSKPSRLHEPINLQQEEAESTIVQELDNSDAKGSRNLHRASNWSLFPVKDSKAHTGLDDQLHSETLRKNDSEAHTGVDDHLHNETLQENQDSPKLRDLKSLSAELHTIKKVQESSAGWLQYPDLYADSDETEQVMLQIKQNGTLPCHEVRTRTAKVLGLPKGSKVKTVGNQTHEKVIHLQAGPVYELLIVSIGDDDQLRCQGGDYYETDLSGHLWKSRPPVVDLDNGTYAVHLQMDPRFAGRYTFTVVLLFANFHALHFHPQKYARMEDIATFEIEFSVPDEIRKNDSTTSEGGSTNSSNSSTTTAARLGPALPICTRKDFKKKHWSGRWTREKFNEDCEYDKYGLWQCVDTKLQCQKPWCEGPVGSLDSNGWVYSAHCAFKIFQQEEAWKCLNGKWLFFWGDSNHVDTIRNLLNFVLGFDHEIKFLDRRMDMTFSSPPDNRSSVRITSIFNGHSNVSLNYEGLYSLHNEEYADQVRSYFNGEIAPDFMIMNSGLHDGLYWRTMDTFLEDGVEYAAQFWSDVWNNMTARRPNLIYRTTVATGGQSRNMSFNPHKMELFNHIIVDKFVKMKLQRFQILDGFDYTFPWHWDHMTNDGVHYGRPPAKTKWAGNNVGHRYFVDLMLVHMLLNAMCIH
ncbi:unnamed protein product [Calypogeia fissa]